MRATDAAGNARTESHTWTVQDVVDPETEITNVTTGSLILEFTGTDDHTAAADLEFQCRVDGGAYAACTSPKTYSDADLAAMTPGQHTFEVRAVDEAGNVGPPDSHTFTVADTKAPDTTITGHPAATTTNTTATFTFTGSDDGTAPAGLTYQCALDTAPFAPCTSEKVYPGLSVGHAHLPGQGDRRGRQHRRLARELHVGDPGAGADTRHDGTRDDDRRQPAGDHDADERVVLLRGHRQPDAGGQPDLRVQARHRLLRAPAPPRRRTPVWRPARTPSRSGRRTPPATSTSRLRATRGRSRARPSTAGPSRR